MQQIARLFPVVLFLLLACTKENKPGPEIFNFTPDRGAFNLMVSINGNHFDSSIANTSVAFNGTVATVIFVNDTLIKVIVPQNATTGKIAVTINSKTIYSNKDFIILEGKWRRKADLPSSQAIANGHAFSIGNKGYFVGGFDIGTSLKELYEYDPTMDKWTRKADCGIDFTAGICMIINGKVYAGLGNSTSLPAPNTNNQLWEYDPVTDQWARKADFPGAEHSSVVGVSSGSKGYVGLGMGGGGIIKDWWEYDPVANSWARKTDMPANNYYVLSTGFGLNNKVYVGPGSYIPLFPGSNEIWEYDPATGSWLKKTVYPGTTQYSPSFFMIGNDVYIAGGGRECWRYNFSNNEWKQVAFFNDRWAGAAFSIGNRGYFLTGVDHDNPGGHFQKDLWEYEP